ncbi:MAG TPA: hypothetical protein VMY37_22525, partial [Thermoguttaceae bacterium]|nr:hypothetical protein [Thermoguttaceae bacterium]
MRSHPAPLFAIAHAKHRSRSAVAIAVSRSTSAIVGRTTPESHGTGGARFGRGQLAATRPDNGPENVENLGGDFRAVGQAPVPREGAYLSPCGCCTRRLPRLR